MPRISYPLISVIMNCHNGDKYLKQSLKSLQSQNYKNWELIFFDNKSNDNSRKILKSFKDNRIKYYKSENMLNLYKARNLAIKKAKGKYISFLDTDDWWVKSKLKDQVMIIQKKRVNFIYSHYFIYNQFENTKTLNFYNKQQSENITQSLLNSYKIGILTVMINKKVFMKKKFNEKYNIIGDFDFFIRLSLKEKFFCIEKPLAYYRVHEKNFSNKISIHLYELETWLNKNENYFKKLNHSLFKIKVFLYKLKIKYLLNYIFN